MRRDDILLLFEYNRWTTLRVLRQAAHLSQRELTRPTWLSHTTVLGPLLHQADVEWARRLAIQEGAFPPEILSAARIPDVRSLREFWLGESKCMLTFVRSLDDERLRRPVRYAWGRARPRTRTLWHLLLHVVNHGTHHRGEVGAYLATIGHSPHDMGFTRLLASRQRDALRGMKSP
ncbi:MAG: DinB family protein [Chloroflexi bacterium]|nr:DinB family protein [Chloroflexota bacterium]